MVEIPNWKFQNVEMSRTFRAFEKRDYRLLWPANLLGYLSRWMQMTLLSWLVLLLTDSPWLVALVGFFAMAPTLILGLLGGLLADRLNRKKVIVFTQVANLTAALGMLMLLNGELERFWHAYVVAVVIGTSWALDMPSRRSLMHDMLGRTGVTNAVALDSMGMGLGMMMGPALAGGLITVVGVIGGYVVVTLAYLISLTLILKMKLPASSRELTGSPNKMVRELWIGLQYVMGHRTLQAVVLVTLLMNLLMFPYFHLVPVIARDVLDVGPFLMGLLQSGAGVGSLVGTISIASIGNIHYHGKLFLGGSLLAVLALQLFSLSRWYLVSFPALLVMGLGLAGFSTMQQSIVMLVSRKEMRGKMLGVISLAIGSQPLGVLVMGIVAGAVNPNFALGIYAAAGLTGLGLIWLLVPSLRQRIIIDPE